MNWCVVEPKDSLLMTKMQGVTFTMGNMKRFKDIDRIGQRECELFHS